MKIAEGLESVQNNAEKGNNKKLDNNDKKMSPNYNEDKCNC